MDGYQESLFFDVQPTVGEKQVLYHNSAMNNPVKKAETVKNYNIKILSVFMWENFTTGEERANYTVYNLIDEKDLTPENGYNVNRLALKAIKFDDLEINEPEADIKLLLLRDEFGNPIKQLGVYNLKDDVIRPSDFEDLGDYGIVYISTHGDEEGIIACPKYQGDEKLNKWIKENNCMNFWEEFWSSGEKSPIWSFSVQDIIPKRVDLSGILPEKFTITCIKLEKTFFYNQDLSNSILYINACDSSEYYKGFFAQGLPKVYLGYDRNVGGWWGEHVAYYYFYYLIDQYIYPNKARHDEAPVITPSPFPKPLPMSAETAYKILQDVRATPDTSYDYPEDYTCKGCNLILTPYNCDPNSLYFPAPVSVIITK